MSGGLGAAEWTDAPGLQKPLGVGPEGGLGDVGRVVWTASSGGSLTVVGRGAVEDGGTGYEREKATACRLAEEPPSLMFLNGNCLESLKKEEPEGGRRRLSHPGNMGWMRPSQEMTPLNRSHHSGFGLFCGVPGPEIESFSLQVSRRRWCWRSTRCSGTMNTHVATSLLTACWTTSQSCAA
ncbi:KRAB domain-containing protein 5 isoform X4 [Pongo abelii]|uniref:KRAB domain-containing protein 5 isoform X4 n=1 Tax=Pongo abelii TaxID=9601 RepID=UPI0023E7F16F|nr:putative protein CLUHP3 [Pongo abelii]